mgnify:CR=1 FL=1
MEVEEAIEGWVLARGGGDSVLAEVAEFDFGADGGAAAAAVFRQLEGGGGCLVMIVEGLGNDHTGSDIVAIVEFREVTANVAAGDFGFQLVAALVEVVESEQRGEAMLVEGDSGAGGPAEVVADAGLDLVEHGLAEDEMQVGGGVGLSVWFLGEPVEAGPGLLADGVMEELRWQGTVELGLQHLFSGAAEEFGFGAAAEDGRLLIGDFGFEEPFEAVGEVFLEALFGLDFLYFLKVEGARVADIGVGGEFLSLDDDGDLLAEVEVAFALVFVNPAQGLGVEAFDDLAAHGAALSGEDKGIGGGSADAFEAAEDGGAIVEIPAGERTHVAGLEQGAVDEEAVGGRL